MWQEKLMRIASNKLYASFIIALGLLNIWLYIQINEGIQRLRWHYVPPHPDDSFVILLLIYGSVGILLGGFLFLFENKAKIIIWVLSLIWFFSFCIVFLELFVKGGIR